MPSINALRALRYSIDSEDATLLRRNIPFALRMVRWGLGRKSQRTIACLTRSGSRLSDLHGNTWSWPETAIANEIVLIDGLDLGEPADDHALAGAIIAIRRPGAVDPLIAVRGLRARCVDVVCRFLIDIVSSTPIRRWQPDDLSKQLHCATCDASLGGSVMRRSSLQCPRCDSNCEVFARYDEVLRL
ncbi:MAG TPA: hypothetical protein VK157_16710 [Phycisphaerales bacterium]|nr:hypothetical protein [Phycisphaerales bacterium]